MSARVKIPRDLLKPRWDWRLYREPIPLELALSCQGDLAVAQLAGPAWAMLAIDSVSQAPDICIPPANLRWDPFRIEVPSLPVTLLVVLAGYAVGRL